MDKPNRHRHTPILIGVGLVLIGLLSGILGMLFFLDLGPRPDAEPRMVERVELGRAQPYTATPTPDSGQAAALP